MADQKPVTCTGHFASDQIGEKSVRIRRISVIRGLCSRKNRFARAGSSTDDTDATDLRGYNTFTREMSVKRH